MKNTIHILEKLRSLSGNEQLNFLNSNKSDALKQVLLYTYDPHKLYKIDEGKYNKVIVPNNLLTGKMQDITVRHMEEYYSILDGLSRKRSAKDSDVFLVKSFISTFDTNIRELLCGILFKDLRLGMNIKKFQKIWGDFCFLYPYMGCRQFSLKNLENLIYPAYAQTKMDGTFCNVIIDTVNRVVEYVSRQGKPQPINGCFLDNFCYNWIADSRFTNKFVLTGELVVWDDITNRPLPRKLSNGILRRDDKTQNELDRIHFICWDFIPYTDFISKRWDVPYKDRYMWLKERLGNFMSKLHIVNTWEVNNVQEAMDRFNIEYANGEEGVVIKSFNQIWQDGKPCGQVKIKAEKDCDLKMVEFIEGKGSYSGMCGAIKCVSSDNIVEVMVKPRTPLDAVELWQNQSKYIDKILTVKYNEKIDSSIKDKISLYLPVFVEIRDDKDEADLICQIE